VIDLIGPTTAGTFAHMPSLPRRRLLYWSTQLAVWALYVALISMLRYLNGEYEDGLGSVMTMVLLIGVGVSHLMRGTILRNRWLRHGPGFLLPRLTLAALLFGALAFLLQAVLHDLLLPSYRPVLTGSVIDAFGMLVNWTVLLFLWAMGYFGYHWFIRQRREEIRNLRLETANRENQLGNLRAQLNPHFMFNALNGIRALVDEDPARAKEAITQLSAILRNSMMQVRRNTVPLGEELDIVKAYLALEGMRYEERLRVCFEVEQGLEREPVPPMMLQTLVENAVRHGIAPLSAGGDLVVGARKRNDGLLLTVKNSGSFDPTAHGKNGSSTGIGLRNTRRRLEMLYGAKGSLRISNHEGMVVTEVEIPAGERVEG